MDYPDVCCIRIENRRSGRWLRIRRQCRRYGPLAVHRAIYEDTETGETYDRWHVSHAASGYAVATDLSEPAAHALAERLAHMRCWEGDPETIVRRLSPYQSRRIRAALRRARRESEAA